MVTAFSEQLITIDELRARMPALRARETGLKDQIAALDAQAADRDAYLRLAGDIEGFLAGLRQNSATATTEDRQRVLRAVVQDILIGPEKLTIRHRIPVREPADGGSHHDTTTDTEGDMRESSLLRWGRDDAALRGSLFGRRVPAFIDHFCFEPGADLFPGGECPEAFQQEIMIDLAECGTGATHYRMRQKLVSIGDDYWIENDQDERVFKVNGKALRVRKTLIFEDSNGRELLKIQERVARVRDTMEIEDRDGHTVATVKKALITPLRDRWTVKVADGPDLDVKGNIVDHEYTVEDGRSTVAEVSKKWFRIADTYGVEVAPGQDPALLLAVTAVLDQMAHEAR